MLSNQTFWLLAAGLAFVTLMLMAYAVTLEWSLLSQRWRPVVVAVVVQQAAIAYGAWESFGSHVSVQARVWFNIAVLVCLILAVCYVLYDRRRQMGVLDPPVLDAPRTTHGRHR